MTETLHENSRDCEPEPVPPAFAPSPAGDAEGAVSSPLLALPRASEAAVSDQRIYLIGDTVLAQGGGRNLPPWSIALFCPHCGRLWGRVLCSSPSRRYHSWYARESFCLDYLQDASFDRIPGSFITPLEREASRIGLNFKWESDLPPAVLSHEAQQYLRWAAFHLGSTGQWRLIA